MIGPLLAFEEDLKLIFTIYLGENLIKENIVIKWEELLLLNKKISFLSCIKLFIDA